MWWPTPFIEYSFAAIQWWARTYSWLHIRCHWSHFVSLTSSNKHFSLTKCHLKNAIIKTFSNSDSNLDWNNSQLHLWYNTLLPFWNKQWYYWKSGFDYHRLSYHDHDRFWNNCPLTTKILHILLADLQTEAVLKWGASFRWLFRPIYAAKFSVKFSPEEE